MAIRITRSEACGSYEITLIVFLLFQEDMIENEVKILRKVNHPNIMALIAEQDTKRMLYLVCEYVAGSYVL